MSLKLRRLITSFAFIMVGISAVYASTPLSSYTHPKFTRFSKNTLPKLREFSDNLSSGTSVFYPFGGPDFLYPFSLFPHATTFILVGMEPIGETNLSKDTLVHPSLLTTQLSSLLTRSFFVTSQMAKDFSFLKGVSSLLCAQALMMGNEIKKVEPLDWEGVKGVRIQLISGTQEKTVIYVRTNLEDESLSQSFIQILQKNNFLETCMIKSASYLLHQPNFSKLKRLILNHTKFLLQDDSGIPFQEVEKNFQILKFFGSYHKPYGKEWAGYTQKDLIKAYENVSSVSFCYGYGCGKIQPALLFATKSLETSSANQEKPETSQNPS